MAITKEKKGLILKNLEDKFSKAKAIYFAEYRGLSVKNATKLREKLREAGVDYVVAKKTLILLAAKNQNLPEIPEEMLTGPVATVFGYGDIVLPSKIVKDFATTNAKDKIKLIGGILEGEILSADKAIQIASLPSKEQLLAQLINSMKSPISGFHGTLYGLLGKFVRTIDAVRTKKA